MQDHCLYVPLLYWVGIDAAFVFLASLLVTYGEPAAAGSGIPEVRESSQMLVPTIDFIDASQRHHNAHGTGQVLPQRN